MAELPTGTVTFLKDLSGVEHLFQVRGDGLVSEFPALRSLGNVLGNLPQQATSFVGRTSELAELVDLILDHRLVTLTGVGGVGKTRLALQVAAEMTGEFGDGVWLVELAPIGDPGAVPDAVAMALGVTVRAGRTVSESIVEALSGRRLLVVLDNCEHVVGAAADLVEAVLARTETVQVISTSREGLGIPAEQLWQVPSLDVGAGEASVAVELFVERARAVAAGFSMAGEDELAVVIEICERLDGIALAIELAAARMVSMSASEVRDRLDARFRLLSGSRRGLERQQTLRNTVAWSYDLLDDAERRLLDCCSVFADGFDLDAATHVAGDGLDEYVVLDLLDSLIRKSLVTTERIRGRTRYGMLETIRQFAEGRLAEGGHITEISDTHAHYFGARAADRWMVWDGPDQVVDLDWVDAEYANLRTGFRWTVDQADLVTAAEIASHIAMMGMPLQRFEAGTWAEEVLEAANVADLAQLPRLHTAASVCLFAGRPGDGIKHARAAAALADNPRYDPFDNAWNGFLEAPALANAGRPEDMLDIYTNLAAGSGLAHVMGLLGMVHALGLVGQAAEAGAVGEQALAAAREHGNPYLIAVGMWAYGRALSGSEPKRALPLFRDGMIYAREHRQTMFVALMARDSALLEAIHGELEPALDLFDTAISSAHQAGVVTGVGAALANLAAWFDHTERADIAATIYGSTTPYAITLASASVPGAVDHARVVLGDAAFDECIAVGAAMDLSGAVRYARQQIDLARHRLQGPPGPG